MKRIVLMVMLIFGISTSLFAACRWNIDGGIFKESRIYTLDISRNSRLGVSPGNVYHIEFNVEQKGIIEIINVRNNNLSFSISDNSRKYCSPSEATFDKKPRKTVEKGRVYVNIITKSGMNLQNNAFQVKFTALNPTYQCSKAKTIEIGSNSPARFALGDISSRPDGGHNAQFIEFKVTENGKLIVKDGQNIKFSLSKTKDGNCMPTSTTELQVKKDDIVYGYLTPTSNAIATMPEIKFEGDTIHTVCKHKLDASMSSSISQRDFNAITNAHVGYNQAQNKYLAEYIVVTADEDGYISAKSGMGGSSQGIKFTLSKNESDKCTDTSVNEIQVKKGDKIYASLTYTKDSVPNEPPQLKFKKESSTLVPGEGGTTPSDPTTPGGGNSPIENECYEIQNSKSLGESIGYNKYLGEILIHANPSRPTATKRRNFWAKIPVKVGGMVYVEKKPGFRVSISKNSKGDNCVADSTTEFFADSGDYIYVYISPEPTAEIGKAPTIYTKVGYKKMTDKKDTPWCKVGPDGVAPAQVRVPYMKGDTIDTLPPLNDGTVRGKVWNYHTDLGGKESYKNLNIQTNIPCSPTIDYVYDGSYEGCPTYSYTCESISGKDRIRFGGAGKYFNGDLAMTGHSIIKNQNGRSLYVQEDGSFNKENAKNSSSNYLHLPPRLNPDDIIFARVYWQGKNQSLKVGSTDLRHINVKKLIKGYRTMALRADNTAKQSFEAKDEDVHFTISSNYERNTRKGYIHTFRMAYAASADVTEYVKQIIKNNPNSTKISITGGEIVANASNHNHPLGDNTTNDNLFGATTWIDGNIKMGPDVRYTVNDGEWSLVVVYHKDKQGDISDDIWDKYYKPKGITVYDGFTTFQTQASENSKSEAILDFDGFFTPDEDTFDAKVSVFGFGNRGGDHGTINDVFVTNRKNNDNFTKLNNGINSEPYIGIIKPGEKTVSNDRKNTHIGTAVRVEEFDISQYMVRKQSDFKLKLYGKGGRSGSVTYGVTNFTSMIALSTDLYRPKLCYTIDLIDSAGSTNNFIAAKGDLIKNKLTIRNEAPKGDKNRKVDDAMGVRFIIKLDENTTYVTNSMKMKNNPEGDTEFYHIADEKMGAYTKPFEFDQYGTIKDPGNADKYPNRKFIVHDKSSDNIAVFAGKGGGITDGHNISGGFFGKGKGEKGEEVNLEYFTRVGANFDPEPKFDASFELITSNGEIARSEAIVGECRDNKAKNITVIDISDLQIVNQNFKENDTLSGGDGKDTLYTQIAGGSFDGKLVFQPKIIKKDKDGKPILDDEGKPEYDTNATMQDAFKKLNGILELSVVSKDTLDGLSRHLEKNKDKYNIDDNDKKLKGNLICNLITDDHKISFNFDDFKQEEYNKATNFLETEKSTTNLDRKKGQKYKSYQFKPDSYINLDDLKIYLANRNLTFVISYIPSGGRKYDTECEKIKKDMSDETDAERRKKLEEDYKKCMQNLQEDTSVEVSIENMLGDKFGMTSQGVYNVCNSDFFSVRPKYIKVDKLSLKPKLSGDVLKDGKKSDSIDFEIYGVDTKEKFVLGYDANISYKNLDALKNLNNKGEYTRYNLSYIAPTIGSTCLLDNPGPVTLELSSGKKTLWNQDITTIVKADFVKENDRNFIYPEYQRFIYEDLDLSDLERGDGNKYKHIARLRYCNPENLKECSDSFSYYNIGYARMKIYDDSWTKADQKKGDCIIGSTAFTQDKKGRVGCDIATYVDYGSIDFGGTGEATKEVEQDFKDLSFKTAPIEVPEYEYPKNYDDVAKKVQKYENEGTYIPLKYSYDRLEGNVTSLDNNNPNRYTFFSSINDTSGRDTNESRNMGAKLGIDIKAKMQSYVDLKDGSAYEILATLYSNRCFANDISFGLRLNYDCANNVDISGYRCDTPFAENNYIGPNGLIGALRNLKMNHLDENVTFAGNGNQMTVNYGHGTFENGEFVKGRINFNFDRSFEQNDRNNPLRIFAEDFINTTPISEVSNENGIQALGNNTFFTYDRNNSIANPGDNNETNPAITPLQGFADFYYGYVNAVETSYTSPVGVPMNALIDTYVYCDAGGGAFNCNSFAVTDRNSTQGNNTDKANFYINRFETHPDTASVKLNFVDDYTTPDSDITITLPANRSLKTAPANMQETITITKGDRRGATSYVKIYTQPYFLYKDGISSDPQRDAGDIRNYNTFNISFQNISQWAGKGGTRDGDNVGRFLHDQDETGRSSMNRRLRRW